MVIVLPIKLRTSLMKVGTSMKLLASLTIAGAVAFGAASHATSNTPFEREQISCIANNIYWEARNQNTKGMIAVGLVTMNRVNDNRYPDTPCEVVHQGPTRPSWKNKNISYPVKNRCQFSWYCDGKAEVVPQADFEVYEIARMIAFKVYYANSRWDFTDGATHYHADYVRPAWASSKTKTITIGNHIFYRWEKSE
jgi:spore germination cell wall hydrolase CwlJ-like protein